MNSRTNDAPQSATFVASLSDVGRVRSVNEDSCDSFLRSDGTRLLVVADGMGGHRGGAVASREALATIASTFTESTLDPARDLASLLVRAIERANERVFSLARQDPELAGMGTTVVAFLLDAEGRAAVAHVGDSRAYRLRGGRLEALTSDHSVVAEMLQRGVLTAEEAAFHPRRNEILRSVGVLPDVEVELATVEVAPDDWFLLCSDGLCGVVSDAEIEEVLVHTRSPQAAVTALVDLANDCGGPDNVTVQILAIPPAPKGDPKPADSSTATGAVATANSASRAASRGSEDAPTDASPRPRSVAATVIALALVAAGAYWLSRLA